MFLCILWNYLSIDFILGSNLPLVWLVYIVLYMCKDFFFNTSSQYSCVESLWKDGFAEVFLGYNEGYNEKLMEFAARQT